jgi:two-component sensor histidine kinase
VSIRWTKDPAQHITLVWDEHSDSIGPRQEAGFGSKLIGIAVRQLDGKLTNDWTTGHLRVTLIFPLQP